MKSIVLVSVATLAMTVAACGQKNTASSVESSSSQHHFSAYSIAGGSLTDVANYTRDNGDQFSVASIGYTLGCGDLADELRTTVKYSADKKKATIYAVGETMVDKAPMIHCFAQEFRTKQVTLGARYAKEDISVEFLQAESNVDAPKDFKGFAPLTSAKVVATDGLCPAGAECILGGTRLTLAIGLPGCVDQVGPIAVRAIAGQNGKATLLVGGANLMRKASETTKCIVAPVATVSVSLINQSFTGYDVELVK